MASQPEMKRLKTDKSSSETNKTETKKPCRVWTIGVSDSESVQEFQKEVRDEGKLGSSMDDNDRVEVSDQTTIYELVNVLCNGPVREHREYDYDITEHLWNLFIAAPGQKLHPPPPRDYVLRMMDLQDGIEPDEDEDDTSPVQCCVADDAGLDSSRGMSHGSYFDVEIPNKLLEQVSIAQKMGQLKNIEIGSTMHLLYDFGDTTDLFLKVLDVRQDDDSRGLPRLVKVKDHDEETHLKLLQQVPAFHLPPEQRLDAVFPFFSRAFLGFNMPKTTIYHEYDPDEHPISERNCFSAITLGLSAKILSEKDTTFCSMESRQSGNDLFYCVTPFADMDEFLTVANEAWMPQPNLEGIRASWIARHVFPSGMEGDDYYEHVEREAKDPSAFYGPHSLSFRKDRETWRKTETVPGNFSFDRTFPKTAHQFRSGRFRWIHFRNGTLRVLVGRGSGDDNRHYRPSQVLRTWRYPFQSFHDLMCAIEASWVIPGTASDPLGDTVLPEFDTDLGPSKPPPKEPPTLSKASDATVICQGKTRASVTAMALVPPSEAGQEMPHLYSGHADGTISKWNLTTNTALWTIQAHKNCLEANGLDATFEDDKYGQEKFGIRGLAVRKTDRGKDQVYSWSHDWEELDSWETRGVCQVKIWDGNNGSHVSSLSALVGLDPDGNPANPRISAVVFAPLMINNTWMNSVVVGLETTATTLDYEPAMSDYDKKDAEAVGEGNILPFAEKSRKRLPTWRGHTGFIRAMAVVRQDYMASISEIPGVGGPDPLILWDLESPGTALKRLRWHDSSRGRLRSRLTQIRDICGIAIDGNRILLASGYGDVLVAIDFEDEEGNPDPKVRGFAKIGSRYNEGDSYKGCMGFSGSMAAICNEGCDISWLYSIRKLRDEPKLDRDEGPLEIGRDDQSSRSYNLCYGTCVGSEMALGKVLFPRRGGIEYEKKKEKKLTLPGMVGFRLSFGDSDEGLDSGGPEVLAMQGRWLVAGFANGAIVHSAHLPEEYAMDSDCSIGSNEYACCSAASAGLGEDICPALADQEEDELDSDT